MLTPGPQKPHRFTQNPRFQALINTFENHGRTAARTPVNRDIHKNQDNETPPAPPHDLPTIHARAINFKDDSPTVSTREETTPIIDMFKSCVDTSPATPGVNTIISTFTNNIAGSLQTCLSSALQATSEETEIQFKFVISKRKVSVKRIVDDGRAVDEKFSEIERQNDGDKENIWKTVAKAVKNALWGDQVQRERG